MHRVISEHVLALFPISAFDTALFDPKPVRGKLSSARGDKPSFAVSGKKDGKNTLINRAQRGTGSGYFACCWGHHLHQGTDVFINVLGW